MTRFLLAGAAALGLMSGAAMAQSATSSSSTSTTTMSPSYYPDVTATTSSTSGSWLKSDGRKSVVSGASALDAAGKIQNGTQNTVTTYPFSNLVTTQSKHVDMVNGMPVETVTTTQAYPHGTTNTNTVKTDKVDIR